MEQFQHVVLIIHIISGSIALIAGLIAMTNQSGNLLHRLTGKFFFWSMSVVFVTAIAMSIYKNQLFLFLVAIFSYYSIVIGYRALYLKKLGKGQKAEKLDWIITSVTALFHVGLIIWGLRVLLVQESSFGIVALLFGFLGAAGNYREYKHYTIGYKEKNGWLFVHISGMIGGYIAAVTAFLVNVVSFQPSFIVWLAPTIIFVPVIIYTTRKFRSKKQFENLKNVKI